MLGCHDFCGYYDWTFGYVRSRFCTEALYELWADAIGRDAQQHYERAGRDEGLLGLAKTWNQTGIDEHCDWTFTLDEARNILRCDMRQCPSKGFLQENDLNADEDYCDHCMGWIIPLLARVGIEVAGHEHNHIGQCWMETSVAKRPHASLDLKTDIRKDSRWNCGYLHRWQDNRRLPMIEEICASSDPCDILQSWFAKTDHLLVVGPKVTAKELNATDHPADAVVMAGDTYINEDVFTRYPLAVLLGDSPDDLAKLAECFHATPIDCRPLLMHTYLPGDKPIDFLSVDLPRPVPILPQLIRAGVYTHQPNQPHPATFELLHMLAVSLHKKVYTL